MEEIDDSPLYKDIKHLHLFEYQNLKKSFENGSPLSKDEKFLISKYNFIWIFVDPKKQFPIIEENTCQLLFDQWQKVKHIIAKHMKMIITENNYKNNTLCNSTDTR